MSTYQTSYKLEKNLPGQFVSYVSKYLSQELKILVGHGLMVKPLIVVNIFR